MEAAPRSRGQPAPLKNVAECGMNYSLGPLEHRFNADGSVTFTQGAIQVACILVPPNAPNPCTFCFCWQLLVQLAPNVWQVVTPPYPKPTEIDVECNVGQSDNWTDTTPVLAPGTYEMEASLMGGPCEIHFPGPPNVRNTYTFTIQ